MGEYGAAAPWEEEGGCGLRRRGRRRRGLRPAAPWAEEEGAAACGAVGGGGRGCGVRRRVRKKAVRLEEEGAAACKRRWGKRAAGVG
jgi:hypothetical protein